MFISNCNGLCLYELCTFDCKNSNSGFDSKAQLSESELQEELIKALNAEKIEHNSI